MATQIDAPDESDASTHLDTRYPLPLRALHWLVAAGFLLLFVTGPIMVDLDKEDPLRATLFGLHKSVGILVLLLAGWRLYVRRKSILPDLPAAFHAWEHTLAHLAHKLLYGAMFIVPLTGWATSDLHGRAVKLFGLPLPKLFPTVEGIGAGPGWVHTVLAYTALAMVVLHVAQGNCIKSSLASRAVLAYRRRPNRP